MPQSIPSPPPATHSNVKLIATLSLLSPDKVAYVTFLTAPDAQAGWFLPNDLLRNGENPYAAAKRIAHAQLGVEPKEVQLVDVDSFTGNDGTWHIAFHFRAEAKDPKAVKGGAEIARLEWMPLGALPEKLKVAHGGWFNGIATRARQHRQASK
ncbi:MAG TPA: NUDIX hydrolase [Stellaceae bacterium]|nr:NUDIX hydrolase [Stellaceae bacterium]